MTPEAYKQVVFILLVTAVLIGALVAWYTFTNPVPVTVPLVDNNSETVDPFVQEESPLLPLTPEEREISQPENINTMNPIAVLNTNRGIIEIELFADTMPVTAGNFQKLAEEGFYDNTKFHRVITNFMIQGGDPQSADDSLAAQWGTGSPGYTIADEHIAGELLTNSRGTIAMANSGPNSGGSQFFINLVDNTFLDFNEEPLQSKHPVFGRVVSGLEVVDAIGATDTLPGDRPTEPVVIESVTIKTEG